MKDSSPIRKKGVKEFLRPIKGSSGAPPTQSALSDEMQKEMSNGAHMGAPTDPRDSVDITEGQQTLGRDVSSQSPELTFALKEAYEEIQKLKLQLEESNTQLQLVLVSGWH